MPQYQTPGVYIEEIEIGAKPIEGVSTSIVGFLGETERGPIEPTFITSFDQFNRLYGGYFSKSYLAYAIEGFFRNGGAGCYVARIAESIKRKDQNLQLITIPLTAASVELDSNASTGGSVVKVDALGPGEWGTEISITIDDAGLNLEPEYPDLFKLTVQYEDYPVEIYDNLSTERNSSDFFEKRVNGISNYVLLAKLGTGTDRPKNTEDEDGKPTSKPLVKTYETITGDEVNVGLGDYDGYEILPTGSNKFSGLKGFDKISDISLVCAPDENKFSDNGLSQALKDHCELHKDRFALLQSSDTPGPVADLKPPVRSKYAAFYHPWIQIIDPATNLTKFVPPGGHIAGIYARTDSERGVHKAPANTTVRGAVGLKFNVVDAEQALLNPKGVNCIRFFTSGGILVWGARTTTLDASWKYINVRRLFIFVEKSILEGTRWAIFEPNDERLWSRMKMTIDQFLTTVWRSGALMGTTRDEAFFVRCDRTTMTQDDIDNGRLVVLVGIAPVKPAEFVIFRIAQVAKGSDISEV